MSECSYFSNVSSVSLASKITNGTESSDTSSSSSSSSTASFSHVAPDGGWGWVIVFASFLVNMIADGVTFSVGVMFVDFQKEFEHSKFRTAGVIGLFHAMPLLSGPIASALTDRYDRTSNSNLPTTIAVCKCTSYRNDQQRHSMK
jgi:hypothetical protein